MQFSKIKREPCGTVCGSEEKDNEEKLPCSNVPVPRGMANVTLGSKITITLTGVVKGFSDDSWMDTARVELELHEGDVKKASEGDEYAAMADDD